MSDDATDTDLGFRFCTNKGGQVIVTRAGRTVTTLRGTDAIDFLSEVEAADFNSQQQVMARVTGNYKRGNERLAASHPRNRT